MKEITELLSALGTRIDLEIAIPVTAVVAVAAAVYFLFRKKGVPPETEAQEQPGAVSAEPEEVAPPPVPPAPEVPPAQVAEPAPEPHFTAPEPAAVEEEEAAAPPADSVTAAEPVEVSGEPVPPEETEPEPEEPKAEEDRKKPGLPGSRRRKSSRKRRKMTGREISSRGLASDFPRPAGGFCRILSMFFHPGELMTRPGMSSRRYS